MKLERSAWIGAAVLLLLLAGGYYGSSVNQPRALLLAPMMDLTPCLLAAPDVQADASSEWRHRCSGPTGSAAHLVEATLQRLQPVNSTAQAADWSLGYTLQVPLLTLLQPERDGWQVNQQALGHIVQTVRDNPRPLVLYLFSTHFGVNAPIEPVLARQSDNLAHTAQGPLPIDQYYGQPLYPWSVARTDNPITGYRVQVLQALLQQLCQLPSEARGRIQGITLLGEVHQLFPHFQSGMGFDAPYQISDYSPTSVTGFRQYLQQRYGNVQALNQYMGSDYASFEAITPPSKDIRQQALTRYQEHIDAFADGQMPITGWVHAPATPGSAQSVQIYLDGRPIAQVPVHLSRQDVRAARPEFGSADLGWRYDLDYRALSPGIHRLDVALAQPGQALIQLGSRAISIMDQRQSTPLAQPSVALPPMQPLPASVAAYIDQPREQAAYYYNPLARDWHAFRAVQVQRYLEYFNQLLGQSCLADTPRYTHQIMPSFNPGWDQSKYAVAASLQATPTLHTGISLYGEASYGRSLGDWLQQHPHPRYGVTEFHPLQGMNPLQLGQVLRQHRDGGARFVSFFLETRWQAQRVAQASNLFAFDPDNPQHASDQLYASMKTLLSN